MIVPTVIFKQPPYQDTIIPADFRWHEARLWGVVILNFALLTFALAIGAGWKEIIAVVSFAPIHMCLAMLENE